MRRPVIVVAAPVVVVAAVVGEDLVWAADGYGFPIGWLVAVALLTGGAVLLSRRSPRPAAAVGAVVVVAIAAAPSHGVTRLLLSCAVTLAVLAWRAGLLSGPPRRTVVAFAVIGVGGGVAALAASGPGTALSAVVTFVVFALLPWLLGRDRARQHALVAATREQVLRLEQQQEFVAERARLWERARLAEEMHDSLGHELSLLALRAGGLELAPGLAPPVRDSVGELRAGIGAATARLAQLISVLHDDAEPAPTAPAGQPLTALIDRARAAGMTVTLHTDSRPTTPVVARAVQRIVQEGLTNAAKHATGAAVEVSVTDTGHDTVVTVSNDRVGNAAAAASSSGQGLIGLAERVRLLGGEFTCAPSGTRFDLTARLPHGTGDDRRRA